MNDLSKAMSHNVQFHLDEIFKWLAINTFIGAILSFAVLLLLSVSKMWWLFMLSVALCVSCISSYGVTTFILLKSCPCGAKTFDYFQPALIPILSKNKKKCVYGILAIVLMVLTFIFCQIIGDNRLLFLISGFGSLYSSYRFSIARITYACKSKYFIRSLVKKKDLALSDIANLSDTDLDYFITCALESERMREAELASQLFYDRMVNAVE
jgi:hypothetical protein